MNSSPFFPRLFPLYAPVFQSSYPPTTEVVICRDLNARLGTITLDLRIPFLPVLRPENIRYQASLQFLPNIQCLRRNHKMSSTKPAASDSIGKPVKIATYQTDLTSKAEIMDCENGGENSGCNIARLLEVGTLYALRRGFASRASTHHTREEATVLMYHEADNRTMYENYVNCGGDLDLAQLIRETLVHA
jgi:hypothetical protein